MTEDEMVAVEQYLLLRDALFQIADKFDNTVSVSEFCLSHGLTVEDRYAIAKFLTQGCDTKDIRKVRKQLEQNIPSIKNMVDEVVEDMIQAFTKNLRSDGGPSMEYRVGTAQDYALLRDALFEIAAVLGDTPTQPISTNLFCLRHGLTKDEHDKIAITILKARDETLTSDELRARLEHRVPKIAQLNDEDFQSLLFVFTQWFDKAFQQQ